MKKTFLFITCILAVLITTASNPSSNRSIDLPYTMGFEDGENWEDWLITDANGDGITWLRQENNWENNPNTGDFHMVYSTSYSNKANDWIFSPKMNLIAGVNYQISFYTKAGSMFYGENLSCFIGTEQNPEDMVQELWSDPNIKYITYNKINITFVPETTGEYVIGFWCQSEIMRYSLSLDDFSIGAAGTVSGYVTDGTNPVQGAIINIDNGLEKITIGTDGFYSVELPVGIHNFNLSKMGYFGVTEEITVEEGVEVTKNFVLTLKPPMEVPYTMGFEDGENWEDWLITDANDDDFTWLREEKTPWVNNANTGSWYMVYTGTNRPANDWLFSPKINLIAGVNYQLSFYTKAGYENLSESLGCYVGTEQKPEAMVQQLWSDPYINYITYKKINITFTPETTGEYIIGFWCYSQTSRYKLYLDDFSIGVGGIVSGYVTDGTNPVQGANINIDNGLAQITTGTDGFYSVELLAGIHNFNVSKSGHFGATEEITVEGGVELTKNFVLTQKPPVEIPYTMSFEDDEDWLDWKIVDANNDNVTWDREGREQYGYHANTGSGYMFYTAATYQNANDWLFSPKINLIAGKKYNLSFFTRASSQYFSETLSCYIGTAQAPEAMVQELWKVQKISYDTYNKINITVIPETTGVYVIGFWCQSEMNNAILYFDDFSIDILSCTVSGYVTDGTDPIQGVNISIDAGSIKTTTDVDGFYSVEVPVGIHNFNISKSGYIGITEEVTIEEEGELTKNFVLTKKPPIELPYTMSFEDDEDWMDWEIMDANNDNATWLREENASNANTGSGYMVYSATNSQGNDWLFSPKINLTAGVNYKLSFYTKAGSQNFSEDLSCYIGNDQNSEAMTQELWSDHDFNNTAYTKIDITITPETTGEYVIGYWCQSTAFQNKLYLDDFSIGIAKTVSGNVTDGTNPLQGVNINIDNGLDITTTNADGFYSVDLLVGIHNFNISKPGYFIVSEEVTIEEDLTKDFVLTQIPPVEVPYTMGFEDDEDWMSWTIIDANEDGATWFRELNSNPNTGTANMRITGNYSENNDWLMTPGIKLTEGSNYKVSFYTKALYSESSGFLSFFMGNGIAVGTMTELLWSGTVNYETYTKIEIIVSPTATGEYVFGIQYPSTGAGVLFDDFEIKEVLGILTGIVTDGVNPIDGALVEIVGKTITTTTDSDGAYSLELPVGIYTVKASKAGYTDAIEMVPIFDDVTTNQDFTLTLIQYTIEATATQGGEINPSGTIFVLPGTDKTFNFVAEQGFKLVRVVIDENDNEEAVQSGYYTFTNVVEDHTIEAQFEKKTYTVTLPEVEGATVIIEDGYTTTVEHGNSFKFRVVLQEAYNQSDIIAKTNNTVINPVEEIYTINNIQDDQIITIEKVELNQYHIVAKAHDGGTINPEGTYMVTYGANEMFTITPNTDYIIKDVVVNGVSEGAITFYALNNITANTTIEAYFELEMGIDGDDVRNVNTINVFSHNNVVTIENKNLISIAVEIMDMFGRVVWKGQTNDAKTEVTLNVAAGIYAVRVTTADHQQFTTKTCIN